MKNTSKTIVLFCTLFVLLAIVVVISLACGNFTNPDENKIVKVSPTFYPNVVVNTPAPENTASVSEAIPSELLEYNEITAIEKSNDTEVTDIPELATENDIEMIARTIWGEAGGCSNIDHRAAVAWAILNRVDAGFGTIEEVITAPYQFIGYNYWDEVCPEEHIELAKDVVDRWEREHAGEENVGRVLPKDYLYFSAYDGHNRFRNAFDGDYDVWDFSWESPY